MVLIEGRSYLTPQEAAERLSIVLQTVYNWCQRGQLVLLPDEVMPRSADSKYLIELGSLLRKHKEVYLE